VIAGREAERAYAALSTELKPPATRIDLVLSDDADYSNGYSTVLPSNRITVYLAPPATSSSTSVYDDWLRLVITHELTHIFHLDRADGIWRVLQRLFGRAPGLFPNTYQPDWVAEGIATYYESRFTAAGRLRGGYHAQLLYATARDGAWPSSHDAVFANSTWPAGNRPYAWGSYFFDSQRKLHGDSVVPRFIDRTSRQLIVFNVSNPMRSAGGETVGDGWERLKPVPGRDRDGDVILDRGLRVGPMPRASPDGSRVCFRRLDGKSDEHIVIRDLATGLDVASRRVNSTTGFTWVGDTVYVTQLEYESPVRITSDVYRWTPAGDWSRISHGARHTAAFATGDGAVGLISLNQGGRSVRLLRYPDTTLTGFPVPDSADDWGQLEVSPDGAWVAAAEHADQRWDIVVWPRGRPEEVRRVTDDAALDADPVWSPNGESLLFSSERAGLPQIYSYDLTTGRTEQVTDEPTGARQPAVVGEGELLFSTVFGDGPALVWQRRRAATPTRPGAGVDSAAIVVPPDIQIREGGYEPWPALRPHFWVPIAHDEQRAGLFWGGWTYGADAIGRTRYSAIFTAAPDKGRAEAVLTLTHKRWASWAVDASAAQTWDYDPLLINGALVPTSVKERTVELGLAYQIRRWRSGVGLRLRGFVERDVLVNEGTEPLPFVPSNPTFAGGAVSASVVSASLPILAVSPENGFGVEAVVLGRRQPGGSQYWSYEVLGRLTGYLAIPLPGYSHWVLAARIAAGRTGGSAPTRYSVGGESSDIVEFFPGAVLGSGRRTFTMRAYEAWTGFSRAAVGAVELRIPVALVARGVPRLPLFLDKVSLNLFGEAGSGWNEGAVVDLLELADAGAEVALDLGVGAGLAISARLGGAVALAEGLGAERGDARYYVAFGRGF
jgi:hypothetical protein